MKVASLFCVFTLGHQSVNHQACHSRQPLPTVQALIHFSLTPMAPKLMLWWWRGVVVSTLA